MPYRLSDNVSFCQVDDHLVILDLDKDRYLRLPRSMETVLLACLRDAEQPEADVKTLVRQGLLTSDAKTGNQIPDSDSEPPLRSSLERKSDVQRLGARVVLEVFSIVCSMQLQLKTRRLVRIINSLVDYRQRRTRHTIGAENETSILQAACLFRQARLYVPIETCCLLDSLSMLRFLAKRRLFAKLVLGVTDDPFSAHCWVQAPVGWVLNDTIGNAMAYTPIRTI